MNEKKQKQLQEILLMPVVCENVNDKITRKGNVIYTGQKYRPGNTESFLPDEDMSDFAVGFYEIMYQEILNGKPILNEDGSLLNSEFAGDTMNSFNTIANKTPGAGVSRKLRTGQEKWSPYLREYYNRYHCLANFWLLPVSIGRTLDGELNKARAPICDYMDNFLQMVFEEVKFDGTDREYFRSFESEGGFVSAHKLRSAYLGEEIWEIDFYSNTSDSEAFIKKALDKMALRAYDIANSSTYIADELWNYFNELHLF